MGAEGWAILIVALLVLGIFYGNTIQAYLTGAASSAQQASNAASQTVQPQPGQQICNLSMQVGTYLVGGNTVLLNGGLTMNNFVNYNWFNCKGTPAASLIPQVPDWFLQGTNTISRIYTYSFISPASQSFYINADLTAPNGLIVSHLTQPSLVYTGSIPQGVVPTPSQISYSLVAYNIPDQGYTVCFTSNLSINGNAGGVPNCMVIQP